MQSSVDGESDPPGTENENLPKKYFPTIINVVKKNREGKKLITN